MLKKVRAPKKNYNLWQLVDSRRLEELGQSRGRIQFICDIDKTYLETTFESWIKIARIAFEEAADKKTVLGASEVLLAARWGHWDSSPLRDDEGTLPRPLHFVSSSPPQLRQVLEEKLIMDGLDWSSDTFKNQAYNIRKRRFDLLREQVAYKTAAILKLMAQNPPETSYFLIGDNAESDPFIYLGIKLLVEGKLSPQQFEEYLDCARLEKTLVQDLWREISPVPQGKVEAIFIRDLAHGRLSPKAPLTDPIIFFQSFFDIALILFLYGLMAQDTLWALARRFHNNYGMSLLALRRRFDAVLQEELRAACREELWALREKLWARQEEAPLAQELPALPLLRRPPQDEWLQLAPDAILQLTKGWLS